MQQLFESLGASDWTVDIPSASGFLCDHPELIVPPDIAGKYLSFGFGGGSHGGSDGYACGLHLASVLANGAVCKCAFYADTPVGSIQEGLAAAWARILPVPLSTLYCAEIGCSVIDECKGGCRYRAEQCADTVFEPRRDGLGADLYRCYAYGIMKPDAGYENRR
jgi:radical SAM protein with 4Fe4S-binding SPASM domain